MAKARKALYAFLECIEIDHQLLNRELAARKPERVYLEIPRWLRPLTEEVIATIRAHTQTVYLSAEDVWGACYLDQDLLSRLRADCLVHVGHAKFCSTDLPVVLVPHYYTCSRRIRNLLDGALPLLRRHRSVHLECSAEFQRLVNGIEEYLTGSGIAVSRHMSASGDIIPALGCRYSHLQRFVNERDAVLFIGDRFYSEGALEEVDVPVYCVDPYGGEVLRHSSTYGPEWRQGRERLFRSIPNCKRVAILVDIQFAQGRLDHAAEFQETFVSRGHRAEVVLCRGVSPEKLKHLVGFDLFVSTGCPRLLYYGQFSEMPVISEQEAIAYLRSEEYPQRVSSSWQPKLSRIQKTNHSVSGPGRKGESVMGFGPYGPTERLIDVKAGFGKCPECGEQALQTKVYEKSGGERIFKNECTCCRYKKELL